MVTALHGFAAALRFRLCVGTNSGQGAPLSTMSEHTWTPPRSFAKRKDGPIGLPPSNVVLVLNRLLPSI